VPTARLHPAAVSALVAIAVLAAPSLGRAGDGVIEINQVRAEAGGINGSLASDPPGFPVVITQAGSYRLTSDLVVPASTTGIRLEVGGARIDLNGFAITGPFVCGVSSCVAGTGSGIERSTAFTGQRTTVRNGEISGFALAGVSVGPLSHVEGVVLQNIGRDAILAPNGSLVIANRAASIGESALVAVGNAPTIARDNAFLSTDLGGSGAAAIEGSVRATGGNLCSDGSCSARGTRRFYLTKNSFTGSQTLTACAPGYHFASLWEIHDVGALEYDVRLGATYSDSGAGPSNEKGWVRSGDFNATAQNGSREPNCAGWTSSAFEDFGVTVSLHQDWRSTVAYSPIAPWRLYQRMWCSQAGVGVWCVED